jgi:hypothetical protein
MPTLVREGWCPLGIGPGANGEQTKTEGAPVRGRSAFRWKHEGGAHCFINAHPSSVIIKIVVAHGRGATGYERETSDTRGNSNRASSTERLEQSLVRFS